MKTRKFLAAAAALVAVAGTSAGVATVVAGADGASNGTAAPAGSTRVGASSPIESKYVPITPCRIVDSRTAPTAFAPKEIRSYKTQGNTASQGGATNCGVPATASALEIDATAVDATGSGFLRIYPAGGAEPNSTFMNYIDGFNASNAGSVAITPGTGANIKVKNYGSSTDLVVEVLGYYVPDLIAVVQSNGSLVRGTPGTTVTKEGTGVYRVNFARDVSGCAFAAGAHDPSTGFGNQNWVSLATNGNTPNGVYVETYTAAGATKVDSEFHLTVTC